MRVTGLARKLSLHARPPAIRPGVAAIIFGVCFFVSPLSLDCHAQDGSSQEKNSLTDGLKTIDADPKIKVDGQHKASDKTQPTIKQQIRTLEEDPLALAEDLKRDVQTESPVQAPQSTNSVEGTLETRDEVARDPTTRSLYPGAYYRFRRVLREWEQKLGLEITFSYDVAGQYYVDDVDDTGGLAGDAAVTGRWLLFGNKHDRPVYLSFRFRTRNALSEEPPSAISSETGLFWQTVDGFNDSKFQVPSMYFSQELHKRELIMRYGQFSIDDFFDNHRFRSAKKFFLNEAFASNPSVNFPSYGAGFVVQWNPNEKWELIGGGSNIQGTQEGEGVDFGLDSTALFGSAQVRYSFTGVSGKEAVIRVMGWHSDRIEDEDIPEGRGLSVTFGHEGFVKGEEFAFRYATSDGDSTDTDTILFLGYGREVRSYDHWGFGLAAGRSSTISKWQMMMETYYRWRAFKELMISPDLQIIVGDHLDREDNRISVVAGLRFGFIF